MKIFAVGRWIKHLLVISNPEQLSAAHIAVWDEMGFRSLIYVMLGDEWGEEVILLVERPSYRRAGRGSDDVEVKQGLFNYPYRTSAVDVHHILEQCTHVPDLSEIIWLLRVLF